jgi:hypothetical protein
LGINFDHIRRKTIAVLNPISSTTVEVASDQDLAGPLAFCLLLGASLLLNGRVSCLYLPELATDFGAVIIRQILGIFRLYLRNWNARLPWNVRVVEFDV